MILRRIEGSRFSRVLQSAWREAKAVIMGCGPSLTQDVARQVFEAHRRGVRVVAVNDAFLLAPWADVQYAADSRWHAWMCEGIDKPGLGLSAADVRQAWASFAGVKASIQGAGDEIKDPAVHILRNKHHPSHGLGLSRDPQCLITGRNSGFQALNLAVLAGARQIVLVGFDGRPGHFHGGHPKPTPEAVYPYYRQAMSAAERDLLEAGVHVVNATPGSVVDSFPKVPLEAAL